jgi:NAD(P)-dependent dehydrogenase (short-subunit alcohol dehydrogenase family)
MGSELEKMMSEETPFPRFGQPADVAPVAVFLAADEAVGHRRTRAGYRRRLSLKLPGRISTLTLPLAIN